MFILSCISEWGQPAVGRGKTAAVSEATHGCCSRLQQGVSVNFNFFIPKMGINFHDPLKSYIPGQIMLIQLGSFMYSSV